jgi:hypothetical protein
MDGEQLTGGVANAGQVTRVGSHVLRPSNAHTPSIHRFLTSLRRAGFDGASEPVGVDDQGRERLVFIEGDVPVAPYPGWAQSDRALASITDLMRHLHDAARAFDQTTSTWSREMADPMGGPIICHNDVCLENVVFREGEAAGFLDFDFAAPGRPVYDLAQMARMCVPIDDDVNAARLGWGPVNHPARLRLVADVYDLDAEGRRELFEILTDSIARGGEFLRRRIQAGDLNFTKMWTDMGGESRFERRKQWWGEKAADFLAVLT